MLVACSDDSGLSRREQAEQLLVQLSGLSEYQHGAANPHLRYLAGLRSMSLEEAIAFLNAWYPISRHQPQILLFLASLLSEHADRKKLFLGNIVEEDGYGAGHHPHYDLLGKVLIPKLGGVLAPDPVTDRMNLDLLEQMRCHLRTPSHAAGALAAIEFPALDVSDILRAVVRLAGRAELLQTDPYLVIHVRVEPEHIIDSHEMALRLTARGPVEQAEVESGFTMVMKFWMKFWPQAFSVLSRDVKAA